MFVCKNTLILASTHCSIESNLIPVPLNHSLKAMRITSMRSPIDAKGGRRSGTGGFRLPFAAVFLATFFCFSFLTLAVEARIGGTFSIARRTQNGPNFARAIMTVLKDKQAETGKNRAWAVEDLREEVFDALNVGGSSDDRKAFNKALDKLEAKDSIKIDGGITVVNSEDNSKDGGEDKEEDGDAMAEDEADGAETAVEDDSGAADDDGDGLSNAAEVSAGTDPSNPDTDSDGLNDADEMEAGTNPNKKDSDNDGVNDGDEVAAGVSTYLCIFFFRLCLLAS